MDGVPIHYRGSKPKSTGNLQMSVRPPCMSLEGNRGSWRKPTKLHTGDNANYYGTVSPESLQLKKGKIINATGVLYLHDVFIIYLPAGKLET